MKHTRSQSALFSTAPLSTYQETNTKCNLPVQVDLLATEGNEYHFRSSPRAVVLPIRPICTKNKALLNPERMHEFGEKIKKLAQLGSSPYHLAIVIGGLSAEQSKQSNSPQVI